MHVPWEHAQQAGSATAGATVRGTLARDGCSRSSLPSPERLSRSPVQGWQIGPSSDLAEPFTFLRSAPSTTSWLSVSEEGLLPDLLWPSSELSLSTDFPPRDSLSPLSLYEPLSLFSASGSTHGRLKIGLESSPYRCFSLLTPHSAQNFAVSSPWEFKR